MSLLLALVLGQTPDQMTTPPVLAFAEFKLADGTVDKNAPSNVWTEYTTTYIPWQDSGYYANKNDMPESFRTPWQLKRLNTPKPVFKQSPGIPSDPHGMTFSYISDKGMKPGKIEVAVLRATPQKVTRGNRIQIFVMEFHHHQVEVRTISGKRYEREKWWTTYGTATIGMACNQDYIPATNSFVKRP